MGHRIELAEIEWAAAQCEGVSMVCAVFDAEKNKIKLFFVGEDGCSASGLTAYCKENLPRYMRPHEICKLEAMPLTANGKIDRVGLANGT
jgi:acyl-coenzyme A synthetase/AMP-(fatty) acid ligase